jgi:hypothetical protein
MLTPGATLNLTAVEYRTNVFVNGSSTYGLRIEGQEAGSQMYPAGPDDTVRDYYGDRLTAGR